MTAYRIVIVNDKMQKGYRYELTEPMGSNFHPGFQPELTPAQMLRRLMTRAAGSNGIADTMRVAACPKKTRGR